MGNLTNSNQAFTNEDAVSLYKPELKWVSFSMTRWTTTHDSREHFTEIAQRPDHRQSWSVCKHTLLAPCACNHCKRINVPADNFVTSSNFHFISSFSLLLSLYCRPIRCEREGKWILGWPRSHWCKPPSAHNTSSLQIHNQTWQKLRIQGGGWGFASWWMGWHSFCSCRQCLERSLLACHSPCSYSLLH